MGGTHTVTVGFGLLSISVSTPSLLLAAAVVGGAFLLAVVLDGNTTSPKQET